MKWSYDPHSYELRRDDWKILGFIGVWTCDLAMPVRRSNGLNYEARDGGSWSFVGWNFPVMNESIYEINHMYLLWIKIYFWFHFLNQVII